MIVGGLAGFVMRIGLAQPGAPQVDEYARSFSLHVTVLAVLALPAIWAGLATHLVPLQIGANRLAFPRLHATSLWVLVAGGGLMIASYGMEGLGILGPSIPLAVNLTGTASTADQLWITGAGLVGLATLAVAISLLTTIVTLRAPAIRLARLPLFSWSVLATAAVSLISIPVHLAGLTILYVDRHFGGELFGAAGSDDVWRHTVWLLGRPEIFLLTLPGLG
ncbi:MAG: cbb3-type cytochrome c oxidase subunit I, partial [Chloroflexota bacterium]|nr:cbb3-type cytochrome c oxidase subunit I [Chloroflexota bacterium]